MQTIFLKEEECYCPLDKFYANVAKYLGYDIRTMTKSTHLTVEKFA